MRILRHASTASVASLLLVGVIAAQGKPVPPAEKRARALVNQLELAERRVAAVEELLALGAAAVPSLAAKLKDPRPEVVQVVCDVLCALGPVAAAAMPQLVTANGSPDPAIAYMAKLTALRVGTTGALTLCEYDGKRIVQIAADGSERVLFEGPQAWDFDLLPDDHLLVTDYIGNKVFEVDAKGKVVWTFDQLKMPLEADRLVGGNTLITDTYGQRVIEVDAKGAKVWEWQAPQGMHPYDVERLANGRTLVVMYPSLVVEVDRNGEVVWKLEELEGVFDADRLLNGNTLIALYGANLVREVNAKGETVWEAKAKQPNDVDRLPNGNTLVGTADSWVELSPDGKVVSENQRGKRVSEVTRH